MNLYKHQYALGFTTSFEQQHAYLASSWLVTQATFLSQHMVKLYIKIKAFKINK